MRFRHVAVLHHSKTDCQATCLMHDAPPAVRIGGLRGSHGLGLGGGLDHEMADPLLRRVVRDRPQQREAPALAVDRVLPRGERHVPPGAAAALPDRGPDQLEAGQRTVAGVQLRIAEFAGRIALSLTTSLTVMFAVACGCSPLGNPSLEP
jgi:hypothetical protein